jgi:hypothetical protein
MGAGAASTEAARAMVAMKEVYMLMGLRASVVERKVSDHETWESDGRGVGTNERLCWRRAMATEENVFVKALHSILMYLLVAPLLEHTSSSSLGYCTHG